MDFSITMEELVGKTVTAVRKETNTHNMETTVLVFEFAADNMKLVMGHYSDCCETVDLEDVVGDFEDLIGNPLLVSVSESNYAGSDCNDENVSETWTYYKMDTIKGGITLRWYGTSNGYYSEEISLAWKPLTGEYDDVY